MFRRVRFCFGRYVRVSLGYVVFSSGSLGSGFVSAGLLRLVRFLYEELWYGEVLNEKNYVSRMDLGARRR
jgi:hypothetical protein